MGNNTEGQVVHMKHVCVRDRMLTVSEGLETILNKSNDPKQQLMVNSVLDSLTMLICDMDDIAELSECSEFCKGYLEPYCYEISIAVSGREGS